MSNLTPTPTKPGDQARLLVAGGMLKLSEERFAVATARAPVRRVRAGKHVMTETRTIIGEVSRDEVRLVDIDSAADGGASGRPGLAGVDMGRWPTLSEERVAITTPVLPINCVHEVVTPAVEHQDVTARVRPEQVIIDSESSSPARMISAMTKDPT